MILKVSQLTLHSLTDSPWYNHRMSFESKINIFQECPNCPLAVQARSESLDHSTLTDCDRHMFLLFPYSVFTIATAPPAARVYYQKIWGVCYHVQKQLQKPF
jgi:hypothetical protein